MIDKYVYAANNPLRYIDPDGKDVTYFYQPGGFAGHAILLVYNQSDGDTAMVSFGPAHTGPVARLKEGLNIPVPGKDEFGLTILLRRTSSSSVWLA